MNVTKHIDWISATFPKEFRPKDIFPLLEWGYFGDGIHGYQSKYIDALTGAVCFTDGRDNMGTHIQLSGSTLSEMRDRQGVTDKGIMQHITNYDGKCSRVDVAINIHNGKITPASIYHAFRSSHIKSTARKFAFIKGFDKGVEGMTFYAGNRQSDRFFRAYDKNAEQKIVNVEAWLRLELELKRLWALGTQGAVKEHGVSAVANAQFAEFMQWDSPEYNEALQGDSAPIDEIGRKQTNTEHWLMEQVSLSLAKVCVSKAGFLAEFMQRVRREMVTLEAKRDRYN